MFQEGASESSRRLSPRVAASPPCDLPPRARPDSPATAAPLAAAREKLLARLFLPRSSAQYESPRPECFRWIPPPVEPARAPFFPASWCDRRSTDHIRRYPRNPDRSQPLLVTMGCHRNPTTLS